MTNGRKRIAIIPALFATALSIFAGSALADTFDVAAFNNLPGAERTRFVSVVLQARDRSLQNVSYKIRETTASLQPDGTRKVLYRQRSELRRLGERYWMRHSRYDFERTGTGKIVEDSVIGWDGSTGREIGFPPYVGTNYHQCIITPRESEVFWQRRYNELLGLRVHREPGAVPITVWFDDAVRRGVAVEATAVPRDGAPFLSVTILEGRAKWTLVLAADRGFMIDQFHENYRNGLGHFDTEVLNTAQFGGVWIPTKGVRRSGNAASANRGEITLEVDDFQVGTVRKEDTEVVFPIGAIVVDKVQKIAYSIQQDGKFRLLPLADTERHVLRTPPEEAVADRIDSSSAKKYRETNLTVVPMGSAEARMPGKSWSPARTICLVITVAVFAVASVVWVRRRRRG